MRTRLLLSATLTSLVTALVTALATTTGAASASVPRGSSVAAGSGPGICAGVSRCHVVAHVDVTGDGARDTVALAPRGKLLSPHSAVLVRVRTASGRTVQVRRKVEFWSGGLWQGAAFLDRRPGRELVIGRVSGAHAQFFQVLTWRAGHLVLLEAPGPGRWWGIDGAVWIDAGWRHRVGDPHGVVQKRVAIRKNTATQGPFRGRVATFRWARDGWQRIGVRIVFPMTDEQAARWGGWQVPGLDRW